MSEQKTVCKIYGMESHELTIQPYDELMQEILLDTKRIAYNYFFENEALEIFLEAIQQDKIFAYRWESLERHDYHCNNDTNPLKTFDELRTIDNETIQMMEEFKKAGLPSGLAAVLSLLNIDKKHPLTINDVSMIQKTGAVIQMDPKDYSSTLEMVLQLKDLWNDECVSSILQHFGRTLEGQKNAYAIFSRISPEISSKISNLNSPALHFLDKFHDVIEEKRYKGYEIDLLIKALNSITPELSHKLNNVKTAWTFILNNNPVLSYEKSTNLSELQKEKQIQMKKELENFGVEELSFREYMLLNSFKEKSSGRKYCDVEQKVMYEDLLFTVIVSVYGADRILEILKDSHNQYLEFFKIVALVDYEKDYGFVDSHLLFSLLEDGD